MAFFKLFVLGVVSLEGAEPSCNQGSCDSGGRVLLQSSAKQGLGQNTSSHLEAFPRTTSPDSVAAREMNKDPVDCGPHGLGPTGGSRSNEFEWADHYKRCSMGWAMCAGHSQGLGRDSGNDDCCKKPSMKGVTDHWKCDLNQGDCDSDNDCRGKLVCGADNCPWNNKLVRNHLPVWDYYRHRGDDCCMCPYGFYTAGQEKGFHVPYCLERNTIFDGDTVFLKSKNTGRYVDVNAGLVRANGYDTLNWQKLRIRKTADGASGKGLPLKTGDKVYVQSENTWKYLDVQDKSVRARSSDQGNWESFTIEMADGVDGITIYSEDTIYLRSHTGRHIDVDNKLVRAQWNHRGGRWQGLEVQRAKACKHESSWNAKPDFPSIWYCCDNPQSPWGCRFPKGNGGRRRAPGSNYHNNR